MLTRNFSLLGFVLPLTAILLNACGEGGDLTTPSTTGTLQVTTVTSGTEPDPDGYSIQIDAEPATPIGNAETRTMADITAGDHSVLLSGLAPNCSVAEDNPRRVTLSGGGSESVTFTITCSATTGSITVSAATTGSDLDPDGYTISVDGAEGPTLGVNGTAAISGLTPGSHSVGLTGVAANCQIQGDNIQQVAVTTGAQATVAYAITCEAPVPGAGSLRISTVTSGGGADPDGYSFAIDGGSATPIGTNASTTLQNVAPGSHSVRLAGLSDNCSVQGTNPQSATVSGAATAEVSFAISCSVTSGTITVTVSTSGSPTDPNGYFATLDGTEPGKPVATGGSVSFTNVSVGAHAVALSGLAGNCSADAASKNVTVTAGATAEVSFAVTCSPSTPGSGSIKVTTTTSGTTPDPDGYTLSLDGGSLQPIDVNGSATLDNVAPGDHSLILAGAASNCTVADNPRTVTVTAGAQASVAFSITCTSTGAISWALIPLPDGFTGKGLWASAASDLYVAGSSSSSGAILHYDGQSWSSQSMPNGGVPLAVWGSGPDNVYAAGSGIWHKGSTGWVAEDFGDDQDDLTSIGGSSPQNVFAGGFHNTASSSFGLLVTYNGSGWTRQELISEMGEFDDVAGRTPTDGWAVGLQIAPYQPNPGEVSAAYTIWHFDGTTWKSNFGFNTNLGEPSQQLTGIWPVAANDVFVVGVDGRILRYNGSTWTPMTSPTTAPLSDVWGTSGSDMFAVGDAGILHYDGTSWTVIDQRKATRVWGVGTDVFVLTEGGVLHGTR
jgi:hypothetical protein